MAKMHRSRLRLMVGVGKEGCRVLYNENNLLEC